MTLIRTLFCLSSAALFSLALSGCATAPRETFYTLNSPPAPSMPANQNTVARYTVAVGPVHIPEIVDRPQLVIRKGPNHVEVLEQHRWAQSLDAEIAQALVADLSARLPQARIGLNRDTALLNADYRIAVDVLRFDAFPAEAISMQANWTISSAALKTPFAGQSAVREAVTGNHYEDVAAAFSRAVMAISEEIARVVSAQQASRAQAGH